MSYRPGDNFYELFNTANISGVAANMDSVWPSGRMFRNGASDINVTIFITNLGVGHYVASGTIPSTYAAGNVCGLNIFGSLNSNTIKGTAPLGVLDSRRLSDFNYWSTTEQQQIRYKIGIDGSGSPPVSGVGHLELSPSGFEQIVIEPGVNARQAIIFDSAALAGTSSGVGSLFWYQGVNNPTVNRIGATAASGIRTILHYNFS